MADTMVDTVLPSELRLGVPPKMPQARTYMFRQQSTLASYTYGQTITINVPRLQRSYLRNDSYLRFRLNGYFTPTDISQSLVLDTAGAWGLFDKMEVYDYLGSTVLESISGHGQLASLLLDLGLKEIIDKNIGTTIAGLDSDYTRSGDNPIGLTAGDTANVTNVKTTITQGGTVRPPNSGLTLLGGYLGAGTGVINSTIAIAVTTGIITSAAHGLAIGQPVVFTSLTAAAAGGSLIPTGVVLYVSPTNFAAGTFSVTTVQGSTSVLVPITAVTAGVMYAYPLTTAGTKTNFSYEFAIPMLSFLGILSKKMVPLHNGFTIVLTTTTQKRPMYLSQPNEPVISVTNTATTFVGGYNGATTKGTITNTEPTPPEWNLTDVYLQCQILELGPVAESMILSSTQGAPLVVYTKAFRNYVGTVKGATWTTTNLNTTGQQEFVLNLNLNVASLTNILWFMRPQNHTDSLLYASLGARTRNFLQRWQFQYGSTTLPQNNGIQSMAQTAPTFPGTPATLTNTTNYLNYNVGFSECFQELLKARPVYLPSTRFHIDGYSVDASFNTNLDNRASNPITLVNWKNLFPSKDLWQSLPRFAAGLNLQLTGSQKDADMISGLNTNGMNTSIRGLFHPLYTDYMNSVTIDAYAEYDAFINISPGIATTVSF
jgi:hypothetical protein